MNNRWIQSSILWGGLLVVGGILFLLQNLGVIHFAGVIWSVLFAILGIFVISFFFADRNQWWALIPGFFLFDLALLIALNAFFPDFGDTLGGVLFLAGMGLSFLIIYLFRRDFWWAVLPTGVLFTLAAVVIVSNSGSDFQTGGVFFLGLGLTFGVLALLPVPGGRMGWAWIPAALLVVMGILITGTAANLAVLVLPAVIILLGIYLIYRTLRPRQM
jgi:hypothetical protein